MLAIEDDNAVQHKSVLPILAHRQTILDMVNRQYVSVIQGDTGCGKSSQVPQFLLQDARARHARPLILCTQPRRIAAISLAKRVADEMGEPIGRSVGYMIGADRVVGRDTQIRFVTTGWAFEKLIHSHAFLEGVTHLVIDEVHERSIDADLLHLLIKLVLPKIEPEKRPKVVLMSATFNASVFSTYYCENDPPEPLFVGVKRYEVEIFHLDEMSKYPPLRNVTGAASLDINDRQRLGIGGKANMVFLQTIRLLHEHHYKRKEACCILVFLSGMAEIDALWEHIEEMEERDGAVVELEDEDVSFEEDQADNAPKPVQSKKAMRRFQLCMLHSSVDKEDQMTIFSELPVGKTRIILSTNIAESSVTIPNARYVIDAGFHKHMAYDERLGCTSLRTVATSKAAAKQRAGRTGRLFPGVALRWYSSKFYEAMPEYDEPDMLRLPLFNTVLRLKVAAQDEVGFSSPLARPSEALSQAIDAPSRRQIAGAYGELFKHGHMVAGPTEDLDDSIVTPLGKFLQKLNVDIRLGSLVVTALVLFPDYIAHAIVLAVSMSLQNVFVHANSRTGGVSYANQRNFFDLMTTVERHRLKFNGDMFSDAFTSLRAFGAQPKGEKPGWLYQHGLHGPRMHQLQSQSRELAGRLAPLAPAHIAKELQHLQARNYRFTFTESDTRILRFMMLYSLSDVLMEGRVALKSQELSNPTNVGFTKHNAPYSDWKRCIFLQKVPHDLLAVGGILEQVLVDALFRKPHGLNVNVYAGKSSGYGDNLKSWVALEFDTQRDAMFAQVLLEGCCKNGKMNLWISDDEKVVLDAPVRRQKLDLTVLQNDTKAKVGGTSAVSYLEVEGTHFFLPGQTVFVGSSVIVEDVTWINGLDEYTWKSLALLPCSQAEGADAISVADHVMEHTFEENELRRLVELKHEVEAATSTQFSIRGRLDLGAEICRSVLGIDVSELKAPQLKAVKIDAPKMQPVQSHKAKVIMIFTLDDSECHAKLNVMASLKLQSVLAVAGKKVFVPESLPPDRVQVRLQRTGQLIISEEQFQAALLKDADAFNILRLEAIPKGMIVLQDDKEEDEEGAEDAAGGAALTKLAKASAPQMNPENDDWLCKTAVRVLRMHADGRMKAEQVVAVLKMATQQPERVTLRRCIDVARVRPDQLDYEARTGLLSLGSDPDDEDDKQQQQQQQQQQQGEFSFDEQMELDETPTKNWNDVAATIQASPSQEQSSPDVQYSGLASSSKKKNAKGRKRSGRKHAKNANNNNNNDKNVDKVADKFTQLSLKK